MTKRLPGNPGPGKRGLVDGRCRLTEAQVIAARQRYRAGGISLRDLAREYKVGLTTIVKAIRGETWTDLEEPPVVDDRSTWWTETEDAYVAEHAGESDEAIGARLGRTVDAVKVRRSRLKVGRPDAAEVLA